MTHRLRAGFSGYRTWLLDCDGVLLDSNRLKTEAFFDVAVEFGRAEAAQLVAHHVEHGGVSRYVKFRWFQEHVLRRPFDDSLQSRLLAAFSRRSLELLSTCSLTRGCEELLESLREAHVPAFVVSGGDQADLREIFARRGLSDYFAGIFGSPRTKPAIIDELSGQGRLATPVLFVGDSRADHEAAMHASADFLFLSAYSEFSDWQSYVAARPSILAASTLIELVSEQ